MTSPFLRWDEAMKLVREEKDVQTRRLLKRFVGAVGIHASKKDILPVQPVDMAWCVEILRDVFGDRDTIAAILDNRPAGEWSDDE